MAARFAMSRAARRGIKLSQDAPDSVIGVGKWDRVMTLGAKLQDGEDFDFNAETLSQCVDNFAKTHTARRMPLDFRHNAARDSDSPEQDLAYYDSVAAVIDGQVVKFWSQDPQVSPPDPAELLTEIQARFPRIESMDGLWARKSEITPLGIEKLPNMHQLSPLFSKDDKAEDGTPIGYNLLNVSAVGVAFQDGTTINLSKRTTKMDKIPENLLAKLAKHGLGEDLDRDSVMSAMAAYMSDTEDGPTDRKAMAACMAAMSEDGKESMGKMDKDEETSEDKSAKMGKKLRKDVDVDPAVAKLIESLTSQNAKMSKRLDTFEAVEQKRAESEFYAAAAQHTSKEDAADYLKLCDGDADKALKLIRKLPKKTGAMGRWFAGGDPVGGPSAEGAKGAPVEKTKTVQGGMIVLHGHGLSVMSKRVAAEQKIDLAAAQRLVAKQHPHLIQREVIS